MKKTLTLIAVVALLVVVSVFVFAACLPSDPAKAKSKYDDKGYNTYLANSTLETAAAKLTISALITMEGDIQAVLTVSNKSDYAGVITYFTSSKDAKAYVDYLKSHQDKDSEGYIKKDGKAVFAGDKEAYKMKKAA